MSDNLNSGDVTYQDIMDAAVKLRNASLQYTMEAMNVWTSRDTVNTFIDKYQQYCDIMADRAYMVPVDLAGSLYGEIEDELNSLYVFATFMTEYFCPYFNLMNVHYDLTSSASQAFFNNTILAPVEGTTKTYVDDMVQYLSAFANKEDPCPEISKPKDFVSTDAEWRYECLFGLPAFAPWGEPNYWTVSFDDVVEKLSPATNTTSSVGSSSTSSTTGATYKDIQDAAAALSNQVSGNNLQFLVDNFQEYSSDYYVADMRNYIQGTSSCDQPSSTDKQLYANVLGYNHVLQGLIGVMNVYFYPYYNLILNNQQLLSQEALNWWNDMFNASAITSADKSSEYYTSFISLIDGLQQYSDLSGQCPDVSENSPLVNQFDVFVNLFKFWPDADIRITLQDVSEKLSPADTSSVSSAATSTAPSDPSSAYSTISSDANLVSTHATDASLTQMNSFAGLSISDFVGYFNIYNQNKSSIVANSIKDVLDAMLAFGKYAESYLLPLATSISNNPDVISTDSQSWWKKNFTDATLKITSSTSMSIIDFATTLDKFQTVASGGSDTIQEGDEYWNALLVMYYFTPWDDSNPIRQALIDAPSNIKEAS